MRDYFSQYGLIKDARIICDPRGQSRGYGFVTYETEADAQKVLAFKEDELVFKEAKLNVGQAFRKKTNTMQTNGQQQFQPFNNGLMMNAGRNGLNANGFNQQLNATSNFGMGFNSMNPMSGNAQGIQNMMSNTLGQNNTYLDLQLNANMQAMQNGSPGMNGYAQTTNGMPNLNGATNLGINMNMNGFSNAGAGLNSLGAMGHNMSHLQGMNGLNSISPLNGMNMN